MRISRQNIILMYFGAVAGFLLLDAAVFRSGLYMAIIEPDSTTGSVQRLLDEEKNRRPSGKQEVLVMGDSRIAEGFSAPLASKEAAARGYAFINGSAPAATPRCWYYIVRDLDPDANRYRAIVLPLDDYEDEDGLWSWADSLIDMHLLASCLRFSDLFDFPASFQQGRARFEAARGTLLKGFLFKQDFQALLENPAKRLEKVKMYREHGAEWRNGYDGNPRSLAGLTIDWNQRTVTFPPGITLAEQADIRGFLLRPTAPQTGGFGEYRRQWFGRIVDRYRSSATRVVFLRIPRGPVVRPVSYVPVTHTIHGLAARPGVILMNENTFNELEHPEFFFDQLHLNTAGRHRFSELLAGKVTDVLQGQPHVVSHR